MQISIKSVNLNGSNVLDANLSVFSFRSGRLTMMFNKITVRNVVDPDYQSDVIGGSIKFVAPLSVKEYKDVIAGEFARRHNISVDAITY